MRSSKCQPQYNPELPTVHVEPSVTSNAWTRNYEPSLAPQVVRKGAVFPTGPDPRYQPDDSADEPRAMSGFIPQVSSKLTRSFRRAEGVGPKDHIYTRMYMYMSIYIYILLKNIYIYRYV